MPEIDFYTFGIVCNDPLLERISSALESLRTRRLPNDDPVALCVSLLERYKRMWRYRHRPRIVFESSVSDPLKVMLRTPSSIESKAREFEVCSVALEIIKEYETYRWHREQITKHIKTQRKIVDRNRSAFFEALVLRDGKRCAVTDCRSTARLRIDHIDPLSRGGVSELRNLQLLCFPCNSKKSNKQPPVRPSSWLVT